MEDTWHIQDANTAVNSSLRVDLIEDIDTFFYMEYLNTKIEPSIMIHIHLRNNMRKQQDYFGKLQIW